MTSSYVDDKLGKMAYDAYATQTGGVSLKSGDILPPWDGLEGKYQTAWIAAARTIEAFCMGEVREELRDEYQRG